MQKAYRLDVSDWAVADNTDIGGILLAHLWVQRRWEVCIEMRKVTGDSKPWVSLLRPTRWYGNFSFGVEFP